MPRPPRTAAMNAKGLPTVLGTPISRRLRSRHAPSTSTSTASKASYNATTEDFDSDSDDFVIKKPKPKPKKKTVKTKSKKTSLKVISHTDIESSQSDNLNHKGPSTSEDLDSQSDVNEKRENLKHKKPLYKMKEAILKIPQLKSPNLSTQTKKDKVPLQKKEDLDSENVTTQSSSEEFKTPEPVKQKPKPLVDLSNPIEYPDIVEEFYTGKIKFIANNEIYQRIELQERAKLLEIRKRMDDYIRKLRLDSIRKSIALTNEFRDILLCDLLEQLNSPMSFDMDMVNNLEKIDFLTEKDKLAIISEDSEDSESLDSVSVVYKTPRQPVTKSKQKYSFPRPNKNMVTPPPGLHPLPVSVFNFGAESTANKLTRLAKPGEVYYSEKGSPIVPPVLSKAGYMAHAAYPVKQPHTIEVVDVDGEKIKVDLVLRSGAPEKAKFFAEFVTDVRGIAATRSTVKHNRIMPPRVPVKSRKGVSTSTTVSVAVKRR